ncbi:MAG TPA: transposase [Planctomycetota bacterium]|nr:transposase [Planctomycetota bacterium]
MPRSRYTVLEADAPHFLTCTIVGWLPLFTRPEAVEQVLDSLRFLQHNGRLVVFGYVVLETHLHLIASAPNLSKEIGDFKSFTARRLIDLLKGRREGDLLAWLHALKPARKGDRAHQLWQQGSHPQMIQGREMMLQKLAYIHDNPVRRGYVDEPTHWRYSSARNYAGLPGLIPVTTDW